MNDPFGARMALASGDGVFFSILKLESDGVARVSDLPFSIKVLLESALRHCDGVAITRDDVARIARWSPETAGRDEVPFKPARVLMQDFTGVPAIADLAAMRDAVAQRGGDAAAVNPAIPVDVVIDHSVQVDVHGRADALAENTRLEIERNIERYRLLRWAQLSFRGLRVVPPGAGIVHQINLEYLAEVVRLDDGILFPDSLVGTDSHTPMINGLGVLGWGVGGIEAEAVMLGEPIGMALPPVVGVRLINALPETTTATDLVLMVTETLRRHGVVDKFVEFYGPGVRDIPVADRATISNMAPEYGATVGLFPPDEITLEFLRYTGRAPHLVERARATLMAQGMFATAGRPRTRYSEEIEIDLSRVEPCVAGPRRPQDRISIANLKTAVGKSLRPDGASARSAPSRGGADAASGLKDGDVVLASITSCTNTSNPAVMLGAGLLARNAVRRGLSPPSYVKTSLAPGSLVVTRYLEAAGLDGALDALGFQTVAYGCATCIGNSGPLPAEVAAAIEQGHLNVCSALSGNRNFEGRIHSLIQSNYLMSPMLVVAFALAGRMGIDFESEPVGHDDTTGAPVFLRDLWPARQEVEDAVRRFVKPEFFRDCYRDMAGGHAMWNSLDVAESLLFPWDSDSAYIRRPPFLDELDAPRSIDPIRGARALLVLGDSVTTDHISPAGSIDAQSPAAVYLREHGIEPKDWNSYGARRGNHEVMARGAFANSRLRNRLTPKRSGGFTRLLPDGAEMSVHEAALAYRAACVPLVIVAGKEYGAGSSRDWAAKGPWMLGVRAILAESYERIHRSNLVGMGILPLQFEPGVTMETLGLTGEETFDLAESPASIGARQTVTVTASREGRSIAFAMLCRLDTPVEVRWFNHGGILPATLKGMLASSE